MLSLRESVGSINRKKIEKVLNAALRQRHDDDRRREILMLSEMMSSEGKGKSGRSVPKFSHTFTDESAAC